MKIAPDFKMIVPKQKNPFGIPKNIFSSVTNNFWITFLLPILILQTSMLLAQSSKMEYAAELNPFATLTCRVFTPGISVSENTEESFRIKLQHLIPAFAAEHSKTSVKFYRASPFGMHYLLQQQYKGHTIYNSYIKINLDKIGNIISVYDNSFDVSGWKESALQAAITSLKNSDADILFEQIFASGKKEIQLKEIIWAVIEETVTPMWQYKIFNPSTHAFREYLVNVSGELILDIDLNCYHSSFTVEADAFVYKPDPLTTSGNYYNPPFVHNNNTTNPSLDAERVAVKIDVGTENGLYVLKNDFVVIRDMDAPNIPILTSTLPEFFFDRSQPGFEAVNVFYHITNFKKYLQSIGFSSIADYAIHADPHALNGDDNSLFSPASSPPRLLFGTGGVEDAEDADVIVHEYGHALSHDANLTNIGNERRALDEGLCDYFATSYSKYMEEFRWQDMFTWDGHNEFWNGRNAATNKTYPADISPSIHANGEMWNTALMEIWDEIGRETTDKLMLQTLYALSPNMTLKNAAYEFIRSDSLMFGGSHFCQIYFPLLRRGLIDTVAELSCLLYDNTIEVNAGMDTVICGGDSILLGSNEVVSGNEYRWQSTHGNFESFESNINVSPSENTTYILRVVTPQGRFNTDSVTITVNDCKFSVTNSIGFSEGSSPLQIRIPKEFKNTDIRLYDLSGKKIFELEKVTPDIYNISSESLSAGVYFLSIYNSKKPHVVKLVKVK